MSHIVQIRNTLKRFKCMQCQTEKKLEIQGLQRLLMKLNFPQPSKKMYQENRINLSATGSAATGQGNSANILLSCDRTKSN